MVSTGTLHTKVLTKSLHTTLIMVVNTNTNILSMDINTKIKMAKHQNTTMDTTYTLMNTSCLKTTVIVETKRQ